MSQVREILTKRMEFISIFVNSISAYWKVVSEIIQSIDNAKYTKVQQDIAGLTGLITEIPTIYSDTNVLQSAADLYSKISTLENCFVSIFSFLNNPEYAKLAVYNMSSTYTHNIYQHRNIAISAHEKYADASTRGDVEIFSHIFGSIPDHETVLAFIAKNTDVINKFTIKLLNWAITRSTGEQLRSLELVVETQKDKLLSAERLPASILPGIEGMLYRYGLVPETLCLELPAIFAQLGHDYVDSMLPNENMIALASAGPGIILVNKSNGSPMEFNLRGLIDHEYIEKHDLKSTITSGLTKKIITKFKTANMLEPGGTCEPIKFFPGAKNTWIVMETINGKLWRLLRKDGVEIPTNEIVGLVGGATTRPMTYNMMQSDIILSKCFSRNAPMYLQAYLDADIKPSTASLQANITEKLTAAYSVALTKITAQSAPIDIKTLRRGLLSSDVIFSVLAPILLHSHSGTDKGTPEYLVSHAAKTDAVIRLFLKELDRQLYYTNIQERIFKENNPEQLKNVLIDLYKVAVSTAAQELDKSNAWTEYDSSLKNFMIEKNQAIL